jgi:hypothetical protein
MAPQYQMPYAQPGFAGNLLRQKPQHVIAGCGRRQPRKQRIALARTGLLEIFVPIDELIDVVVRDVTEERADLFPHRLDIFALCTENVRIDLKLFPPSRMGNRRMQLPPVVFAKFGLKSFEAPA